MTMTYPQYYQGHLRGISPRPIEGTIKAMPITQGVEDGLPFAQRKWNNGLSGPDRTDPSKLVRNQGDTFLDEYLAAGQSGVRGVWDSYSILQNPQYVPESSFRNLMGPDYADNHGQGRQMWDLGGHRDSETVNKTWASDTIGDGKTYQYYHFAFRQGARDPKLNIELPTVSLRRNLVGVTMVPISPSNRLVTGAIDMSMPKAEWGRVLSIQSPDLYEIAKAVFAQNLGFNDSNIQTVQNNDRSISAYIPGRPELGTVDIVQFDTSFWTGARDMVTVVLNNVQPAPQNGPQNKVVRGNLVEPGQRLWGLIKHLRNGNEAGMADIRQWLGISGVRQFYRGVEEFVAKRVGTRYTYA